MRPTHIQGPTAPRIHAPAALAWIGRGVAAEEADVLGAEPETAALVEAVAAAGAPLAAAAAFVVHEVRRALRDGGGQPDPARLAALVAMIGREEVTNAIARQALGPVLREGADPATWVAARGLTAIADDDALTAVVTAVLAELSDKVAAYRAGRTGLFGMFVGNVMKRTGGRADAARVTELLNRALSE